MPTTRGSFSFQPTSHFLVKRPAPFMNLTRVPGCWKVPMAAQLSAYLRHIPAAPNRHYTRRRLQNSVPNVADSRRALARGPHQPRTFDPHWPCTLPPDLQDRLVDFIKALNSNVVPMYGSAAPVRFHTKTAWPATAIRLFTPAPCTAPDHLAA